MRTTRVCVVAALCLGASALLSAQQAGTGGDSVVLKKIVQFAVPATPALSFIGATGEKITRPTAPKEFATMLSNAIDESGRVVQGLAMEFAPRPLLLPMMDAEAYRTRRGFILANTAVSLGTVKVTGDTASTNLGFGIRTTIFDRSDPMTANGSEVALRTLLACAGPDPIPTDAAGLAAFKKCFAAGDSVFRMAFRRDHWNDWGLTASFASGMQLRNSEWGKGRAMGWTADAVLGAPLCLLVARGGLCRNGQWLVQAGYEKRDSITGGSRQMQRALLGVRNTIGTEKLGFFAEALWASARSSDYVAGKKKNSTDWSAGIEFRISDALWATAGFGSRYNDLVGDDKAVILGGLRANLAGERSLGGILPGR